MINQIQPWINNEEGNYLKKILKRKYLTEDKETQKFENNLKKNLKLKMQLQSQIGPMEFFYF